MRATTERTGATESQIEGAALRMHAIRTGPKKIPHGDWPCAQCHGHADAWAPCFVDSDHRIVANDADHLSQETAAAVQRLKDISQLAQGLLLLHGAFGQPWPSNDLGNRLTEMLEAQTLPHDWERVDALLGATP